MLWWLWWKEEREEREEDSSVMGYYAISAFTTSREDTQLKTQQGGRFHTDFSSWTVRRNHTLDVCWRKNEKVVYFPGSLMSPFFMSQILPFGELSFDLGWSESRLFRMLNSILGGLVFHPGLKVAFSPNKKKWGYSRASKMMHNFIFSNSFTGFATQIYSNLPSVFSSQPQCFFLGNKVVLNICLSEVVQV